MGEARTIDECLSTKGGHLLIDGVDTVDIVRDFGSPVFVVSEEGLRRNIRRFQRSFEQGWPDGPVKVMPAAKACWISAIQRIIASEGCGCDVYSAGELAVALASGFDPRFVSVNGVPKEKDHIFNAVKEGACITIDGAEEIEVVEQAASELNTTAKVRLRLKPVLSGFTEYSDFVPTGPLSTYIAAMAYKGGMPREAIIAIGKRALRSKHIEVTGFHQHHGRHRASTRYWEEQMKSYAREIGIVSKALGGLQPREIDIGGGFACPRDPFGSEIRFSEPYEYLALYGISKALAPFPKLRYRVLSRIVDKFILFNPERQMAPTIEEYAAACTATLRRELPAHGIDPKGVMLQLEPGRSLHGDTGIHLTRVRSIKRMRFPITWSHAALDTTEFWFTGGRYEHHVYDYLFANKTDAPLTEKMDVVGRSCYGDRMFPAILVPEDLEPGDIMAILDVGAYQEVSMSNFNAMPRPATLLVGNGTISVIRRAETLEDVFRRDGIPDHLLSGQKTYGSSSGQG